MRPLFAAVGLVIAGAVFVEAGPATRPAEPATTRPTADESVIGRAIAPLVRNLASPRYAVRQAAQRRLESIGAFIPAISAAMAWPSGRPCRPAISSASQRACRL